MAKLVKLSNSIKNKNAGVSCCSPSSSLNKKELNRRELSRNEGTLGSKTADFREAQMDLFRSLISQACEVLSGLGTRYRRLAWLLDDFCEFLVGGVKENSKDSVIREDSFGDSFSDSSVSARSL